MKRITGLGVAAALATPVLLTTGTASAVGVGEVALSVDTLVYQAGSVNNSISVQHSGAWILFDDIVDITPGITCWYPTPADHTRVACDSSGVKRVQVFAGGGSDGITSWLSLPAILWGQAGDDNIHGGPGDDILRGDSGKDQFWGGGGRDGVTYYGYAEGVTADADGVSQDDGAAGEGDTIASDVEDLYGGEGRDRLYGNSAVNYINGNGESDWIQGFGSVDTLAGSDGDDTVLGGEGGDFLYGGPGGDHLYGEAGNDHIEGGDPGYDWIDGGTEVDTCLYGDNYTACEVY